MTSGRITKPSVDQWPKTMVTSAEARPGTSNQGTNPSGCAPGADLIDNAMRPLGVQILALAYRTGEAWNEAAFSNAEFDDMIDKADATADVAKRNAFLQEATKIAVREIPMIPIHYEQDIYAAKKSVTVVPRMDKFIWAYEMDVQ